jgi:hypothetical protein
MSNDQYKCYLCKKYLDSSDTYEYRGAYSCEEHHDQVIALRSRERQEIIEQEHAKTECFRGLDLDPTTSVGRGTREIMKRQLELAKKESSQLRRYERGEE